MQKIATVYNHTTSTQDCAKISTCLPPITLLHLFNINRHLTQFLNTLKKFFLFEITHCHKVIYNVLLEDFKVKNDLKIN